MAARNDITGDSIQTKGVSNAYRDNYDLIWGKKDKKMKIVIWSKNLCTHCEQAKNYLRAKSIEFEERNIDKEWTKEQLLEAVPGARTVPQIFVNEELIGGFSELKAKLDNAN